jgi:hypothetical protein
MTRTILNPAYRYQDGPDMWLTGTDTPSLPAARVDGLLSDDGKSTGESHPLHAGIAYRFRMDLFREEQDRLYEDAERDAILDWRESLANRAGMHDLDCHRCRMAVFVPDLDTPCPTCGGPTA